MGKSVFIVASWLMFNIDSRRGDIFFIVIGRYIKQVSCFLGGV